VALEDKRIAILKRGHQAVPAAYEVEVAIRKNKNRIDKLLKSSPSSSFRNATTTTTTTTSSTALPPRGQERVVHDGYTRIS